MAREGEGKRNNNGIKALYRIKGAFLSGDLATLIFLLFYFKSEAENFGIIEFAKNSL